MNKKEWNEGLNYIDSDLVEEYVEQKEKYQGGQGYSWLRIWAIAACFCLIIGAAAAAPALFGKTPGLSVGHLRVPSAAPHYYGSEASEGESGIMGMMADYGGISVTARLKETLPDTYTVYDDWAQTDYRLLKMEVLTLLKGKEMTEEFYYLIPAEYMTDFSVYDRFVLSDMAQYGYEYSVLYNKTQNCAEQKDLPLFGFHYGCESIMAFDSSGQFDPRLWEANEAWVERLTLHAVRYPIVDTIEQAEERERQDEMEEPLFVRLLDGISEEGMQALSEIKSFENGIFVPKLNRRMLYTLPEVEFFTVRYIDGFATNEAAAIFGEESRVALNDTYFTKAHFTEKDLKKLPDLPSAVESVTEAFEKGEITPPHIQGYEAMTNTDYGIFAWYAKTEDGVLGIVRVTWRYTSERNRRYYDDQYYLIEYGSKGCQPIGRDALLDKFGDCETTYIFAGEYSENGKNVYIRGC